MTNCGAVSTSLILMPTDEGMNHVGEKSQPPALQNIQCYHLLPSVAPHPVLTTFHLLNKANLLPFY